MSRRTSVCYAYARGPSRKKETEGCPGSPRSANVSFVRTRLHCAHGARSAPRPPGGEIPGWPGVGVVRAIGPLRVARAREVV